MAVERIKGGDGMGAVGCDMCWTSDTCDCCACAVAVERYPGVSAQLNVGRRREVWRGLWMRKRRRKERKRTAEVLSAK